METELTKKIKKCTHFFKPLLPTKMRTIRYADEVTTPTGIVDSIRFEDYIENDLSVCRKIKSGEECKKGYDSYGQHCSGCMYPHREYEIGMCITCFECKITLSDFKSNNGHNFHGNKNYYVVPKELIKQIEKLVPKDIGILSYNNGSLRVYKECEFKKVDDKLKIELLYNAMKKWCDGKQTLD